MVKVSIGRKVKGGSQNRTASSLIYVSDAS